MNFLGWKIDFSKINPTSAAPSSKQYQKADVPTGVIVNPWDLSVFDGEKTIGELGRPLHVVANPRALRMRAYEVDLKADLVRAMTSKFFKWTIGDGLKLQANPSKYILESEGLGKIDISKLKKQTETRFNLLAYSKNVHQGGMKNLHELADDAFSDSFLGGDSLVIFRIRKNGYPTVQVIDGQEIVDPPAYGKEYKEAEAKGHYIKHGIEYDKNNSHIAYFVRQKEEQTVERVDAFIEFENFKFRAVRIIYGRRHRINDLRGISSLTSIIEKIDKLDRFSEASVAAAEERANIVYAINHSKDSTGENPTSTRLLKNVNGMGGVTDGIDPYEQGNKTAKLVTETTAKQAFNMPIGSELKVLDSDAEFNYDKFLNSVFDHLCAALDIPPEVALQKYSSNYSASRAAINAWQYIIKIYRQKFAEEFYQPYYELFFYCQCLMGKLEGSYDYINVAESEDFLLKDAFTNARFLGVNMPHIDPLKEVKAVRELLGSKNADVPLISFDQATEQLNQGDWEENFSKYSAEIEDNDLEPEEPEESNNNQNTGKNKEEN